MIAKATIASPFIRPKARYWFETARRTGTPKPLTPIIDAITTNDGRHVTSTIWARNDAIATNDASTNDGRWHDATTNANDGRRHGWLQ